MCYVFIDESGVTASEAKQKYFILSMAISKNKGFIDDLIFSIRDECIRKGKPIVNHKEIKYHDISRFQKEIVVQRINLKYKNFYIAFTDIESSHKSISEGKQENLVQSMIISAMLGDLFSTEVFKKDDTVRIIMDEKLPIEYQRIIRDFVAKIRKSKKGISVEAKSSRRERGIQLADILAGAFREKLTKKSDLFQIDHTHVFNVTIPEERLMKVSRPRK